MRRTSRIGVLEDVGGTSAGPARKRALLVTSWLFLGLLLVRLPVEAPARDSARVVFDIPPLGLAPPPPPPPRVRRPVAVVRAELPVPGPREVRPVEENLPQPAVTPPTARDVRRPGPRRRPPRAAPGDAAPLRVGQAGLTPPTLLHRVEPAYPLRARRYGAEGIVVLEAIIDVAGRVKEARIVGGETKHGLADSALDAVRGWRYAPARLEGRPVEVVMTIRVTFGLR